MEKKDICKGEGYELAELKSSLLVQTLVLEDNPHNLLLEFIQTLARDICEYMGVNLRDIIGLYTSKLDKGDKHAEYEKVAQSHVWANYEWLGLEYMDIQLPPSDTIPRGVYTNVFAMINFIKWLWFSINDIDSNNTRGIVFLGVLIRSFQQNMLHLHLILRGERKDEFNNTSTSTDVGISNIRGVGFLKRRVRDVLDAQIKPWVPFGRQVCKMGKNSIYMERLDNYRNHTDYINNFYSSVMCGLSGSSQFTLFMFLCSIAGKGTESRHNSGLVGKVLQIACVTLVGAGGHNIREVLSGLVITVVFLYHLIIDVLTEVSHFNNSGNILGKDIYSYISNSIGHEDYPMTRRVWHLVNVNNPVGHSTGNIPVHECFFNIVNTLENWKGFITTFYEETKGFNMLGLFMNDIDDLKDVSFENCKDRVYNHILGRRINTDNITKYIQLFYSLESNRLHLDPIVSFRDFPSRFMDIINIRLHINSNLGIRISYMVSELRNLCNTLSDLPDGLIRAIALSVDPTIVNSNRDEQMRLLDDYISNPSNRLSITNIINSTYRHIHIPFA